MRVNIISVGVTVAVLVSAPVHALESYPKEITDQFMSWCARSQNQPQTVCTCAVNRAATEIPENAMVSFLAAPEGAGMATTGAGVSATILQIVTSCASSGSGTGQSTGSPGGSLMDVMGGALGR